MSSTIGQSGRNSQTRIEKSVQVMDIICATLAASQSVVLRACTVTSFSLHVFVCHTLNSKTCKFGLPIA